MFKHIPSAIAVAVTIFNPNRRYAYVDSMPNTDGGDPWTTARRC